MTDEIKVSRTRIHLWLLANLAIAAIFYWNKNAAIYTAPLVLMASFLIRTPEQINGEWSRKLSEREILESFGFVFLLLVGIFTGVSAKIDSFFEQPAVHMALVTVFAICAIIAYIRLLARHRASSLPPDRVEEGKA